MCYAGFFLTNMDTTKPTPPVAYQIPLRPALPSIYGPVKYRDERDLYERVDRLLHSTDIEREYIAAAFAQSGHDWSTATPAAIDRFGLYATIGLRSAVARSLTGLSLRGLTTRAADSTTLAWFLGTADIERVRSPSKSTVHRLGEQVDAATLRRLNELLTAAAIAPVIYLGETVRQPAGLDIPMVPDNIYFDATCLKAPIHLPTDWILLRDATRSLMLATASIRRTGLKVRMPQEPLVFLSDINALCMQMASQRRRPDSKKNRKATLRLMKKLTGKVAHHARAHRDLLTARRSDTALSEKEAAQIIARIDNILTQLPGAIRQAHERIIGGRPVPNGEKILSLYDPDIDVIVRGKAGAEVEFGSKLWLGELDSGLIVDYILLQKNQDDTTLIAPALERLKTQSELKAGLKTAFADRGIHSAANEKLLEAEGITSGLCPRQPQVLAQRLQDEPWLRTGLKRRGATETRIAIFTNVFCQGQLREKIHAHRELAVGRAILAHNLYVIAKLQIVQEKATKQASEAAIAKALERTQRREAA